MYRVVCKSKIHRAVITDANLEYEGSIAIDPVLLDAADIYVNEMVWVFNINNGQRFQTYIIKGTKGSGEVCLNGAAARLGMKGDKVIILSTAMMEDEKSRKYKPKMVLVGQNNKIKKIT